MPNIKKLLFFSRFPRLSAAVGCGVAGVLAGILFHAYPVAARTPDAGESGRLEVVGRLTSKALDSNHFRKQQQDEQLSSRIFDEYLKLLDPAKMYFTRIDIAGFEKDRFHLLAQLNNGKLTAIYGIYKRFLERLAEYRAYAEDAMQKGFDFTIDETYQPDRKDAAFCRDETELRELWRKRLKNDLLYYRLMQRVMSEKSTDPEVAAELKKRWNLKTPEEKVRTRLHDLYNLSAQVDKMDVLGIFLTAMAQVYGPHSHYSTPKQEEDFDIQFKLSLSGIGATLTSEDGYTKIVDLVAGGPADKSGRLQPEDRIIAVAQEGAEPVDIIDMSVGNVVKLVRGPAGSKVTLTVLPAAQGAAALPEDITIVRGKVELTENAAQGTIENVSAPNGGKKRIGVIRLNSFYMDFDGAFKGLPDFRSCTRDVRRILERFAREKVDAVLLDLRANSGGSLVEAISLSGLFIKSGPIVQVMDSSRSIDVQKDPDPELVYGGPLVLLVSKFSASSAEILAGAMQDYRRALVIGDSRTYGKGTVLGVINLTKMLRYANWNFEAGSVTYETAMFYRVNGESNQQRGVASDIVLPSFTEEMEIGELFNNNHLPWDKVAAADYPAAAGRPVNLGYEPLNSELKSLLAKHSAERFEHHPALRKFVDDIRRFKAVRERREVSLNEARRLKEYYDEKAAVERADEFIDAAESADKNAKKKNNDVLLIEALTVTAEYAELTASGKAPRYVGKK